ncbi:hypothetical protein C8N43_3895 [Litoreibacter ponti]|uniref:Uncharacterized protein n=1 Tax=Litoreibacter ponti TaxID=1510457 RepID=A0A2T6BCU6_9RHOB|nr:hypothetical protein [Litoreibacter ponti]PTX53852.1 hypothetical protein C8N43_3895 [Litoreibacter ponti]
MTLTPLDWITLAALGAGFGILGQLIRIAVGIHKLQQSTGSDPAAFKHEFDSIKLWLSLLFGILAGVASLIGMTILKGEGFIPNPADGALKLDGEFILTIMAAGYAGADFIEGFVKSHVKP